MTSKLISILKLPDEAEIESSIEWQVQNIPAVVRKTIRYRSGIIVVLSQDFSGNVFQIVIRSESHPFRISNNEILSVRPGDGIDLL